MENNSNMSLLAQFDDACMRDFDLHGCDNEFLEFALGQDECRNMWLEAERNVQIMHSKINEAQKLTSKLELLNHHVTMLLKDEVKVRTAIQEDIRECHSQFDLIRDCLSSESDLKDEFREKLHSLSVGRYPHLMTNAAARPIDKMDTITEVNSAEIDSLMGLSDKSSSGQTESDLELSGIVRSHRELKCSNKKFSELVPSNIPTSEQQTSKHAKNVGPITTIGEHKQCIVATTTVSFSIQTGTTVASTMIESNPGSNSDEFHNMKVIKEHQMKRQVIVNKTENCNPCGLRIKFGKSAVRCIDCGLICHMDCVVSMPTCCNPQNPEIGDKRREITSSDKKVLRFFTSPSTKK
ncbi:rac GTPase-activating protein 1-like [Daphnia carinata]|uniref:rac GTPase-activating protein 1-like n=1 Tax=Daphnia carinata TaxID=120202 RepID=UPI00257B1ABF|nr:rac GTPase-activating protein 1-like [Daphnia carinata]